MAFDTELFGKKLIRYRNQLLLDIGEISKHTGIDEDRIARLEKGLSEPTGDEVLIFSDFYKQDYNYFISNEQKAASEQVDILYRKFGDDFRKEDRWAIQEFLYLCEIEQQIFGLIEYPIQEYYFERKGNFLKRHGEDAAKELRRLLSLNDNSKVLDFYSTFRKLGLHIFRKRLSNSNISGLFINHPWAGKCILINYDEDIYRQNFSLAHEVAHALFDYDDSINISFESSGRTARDLREIRANVFASNFLIPPGLLHSLKIRKWDKNQIISLANQLQVNVEPLLISLANAGVISNKVKEEFIHLKVPMGIKLDPELKNLSHRYYTAKHKLLEKGLSSFYVKNCFEAYSQKQISSGKLAEALLCSEKELNELLDMFGLKLFYEY